MTRATIMALALTLGLCGAAHGRVVVQLESAPPEVSSFEPVPVLYSVQNAGSVDVVLPVDSEGAIGYLEFRRFGSEAWSVSTIDVSKQSGTAKRAERLAVGSSRLVLANAGFEFDPEGRYEVRVRVWSGGDCVIGPVGETPAGNDSKKGRELTTCTTVEIESEVATVRVVRPTTDVDKQAWEFLGRPERSPLVVGERFTELVARFPNSHYTYAAAFRANRLDVALRLQPDNPLSSYVAALLEARRLQLARCCDEPSPAKEAHRVLEGISSGLRQYLSQLEQARRSRCQSDLQQPCPGGSRDEPTSEDGTNRSDSASPGAARQPKDRGAASAARVHSSAIAHGAAAQPLGVFPSAMGFKQRVLLSATPTPSAYWLALPFRYEPEDVGTIGIVDAEDLCQDAGESGGVTAVLRWDEPSSTIQEYSCGTGSPFTLLEGVAYGIWRVANWSLSANLAGGHNDSFAYSIAATGGSQLSWVSVPYHVKNATGQGQVTAEGLCQQIGSSEVLAIVRLDPATGVYGSYGCGSTFESPFVVQAGEGLGLVNRDAQSITWQPLHY